MDVIMNRKKTIPQIARALSFIGNNIRNARKKRRMSLEYVARNGDISIDSIKRLEAGDPQTTIRTLVSVFTALGSIRKFEEIMDISGDDKGLLSERLEISEQLEKKTTKNHNPLGIYTDEKTEGISL